MADNTSNHLQERDNMDSQTKEVMDILQEECAEVIQAVSKISRFGPVSYTHLRAHET